jgi:hypothetical protein
MRAKRFSWPWFLGKVFRVASFVTRGRKEFRCEWERALFTIPIGDPLNAPRIPMNKTIEMDELAIPDIREGESLTLRSEANNARAGMVVPIVPSKRLRAISISRA